MKAIPASIIVLLVSAWALAQPAHKGLHYSQSLGLAYNPLGALVDSRLFYRWPLVRKEGILWEGTRIDLGLRNELTPTDDLLAASFTIVPIAFFELTVEGGLYLMYRQLGFGFCEFDSADASYGSDAMDDVGRSSRLGYWFTADPSLRLSLGPVVMVDALAVDVYGMGNGNYFLERRTYSLRAMRDVNLINDVYLLLRPGKKVMFGFVYRYLYVTGTDFSSQRVSGAVILTPTLRSFERAYGVAVVGLYLRDRVLRGKPYIGVKLGFDMKVGRDGPGEDGAR